MSCSLHQGLHERGRFAVRVPGRLLLGRVVGSRRGRRTNCRTCRNGGQTVHHESTPVVHWPLKSLDASRPPGRSGTGCKLLRPCNRVAKSALARHAPRCRPARPDPRSSCASSQPLSPSHLLLSPRRLHWRATRRWRGRSSRRDRKSTRLNSSHGYISYAVFCLKKKKKTKKSMSHSRTQMST